MPREAPDSRLGAGKFETKDGNKQSFQSGNFETENNVEVTKLESLETL